MALLHRADLRPSKLELLTAWLPTRPWYGGPAAPAPSRVASCRFDDPAGEVGIEMIIFDAGDGRLLHAPLTYRDAPLAGGDRWLLGTAEHSVLGRRWIYDACGDPVYVAALANAILTGGGQAPEYVADGETPVAREPEMLLRGSGGRPDAAAGVDTVLRVEDADPALIVAGTTGNAAGTTAGNTAGTTAGNAAGTTAGNAAGTTAGNAAGTAPGTVELAVIRAVDEVDGPPWPLALTATWSGRSTPTVLARARTT